MSPLFIIFLHLGLGGVQRKIIDLVNFLASWQPNLPIYIILRNRTDFDLGSEIKNKKVKIINYADWNKFKIRYFFPFFVLYQVWCLKPSAILAFLDFCSIPAIWAKYIFFWRRIKVVLSEDHYASQVISSWKLSHLRHWLIKIFYPLADTIFTCSQANKKDLVVSYNLPEDKIKIIQNWTSFSTKTNLSSSKKYDLIYIGRLEKTKNLPFLLESIVKLKKTKKKIKLLVLGEGKEEFNLKKITRNLALNNNVIFLKPTHKVVQLLNQTKIFVYCSCPRVEGLPMAILEAMAVGVPVLTRDFAGAQEFLQDGRNCYLFRTKREFIKKTIWLLNSIKVRKKIALLAKQYVKQYHSPKNMLLYIKELGLIK